MLAANPCILQCCMCDIFHVFMWGSLIEKLTVGIFDPEVMVGKAIMYCKIIMTAYYRYYSACRNSMEFRYLQRSKFTTQHAHKWQVPTAGCH